MIPVEAVEAAAKALWERAEYEPWIAAKASHKQPYFSEARSALEAAAPYMMATAWDQGELAGSAKNVLEGEYPHLDLTTNPYRSQA